MDDRKTIDGWKPLVSLVIPGFNEEALVLQNLTKICDYMSDLIKGSDWEVIFVNDGSTDKTGDLADEFARNNSRVRVIHHVVNLNLGNALRTGFSKAKGQYLITLDVDLSYAPYHIGKLLETLISTNADVVVASPYMKGGKVTGVPFIRKILSRWVNYFMRFAAQEKLHTYTCMVRGYKTEFIRSLNLKTKDFEINPEILYKSMILRARIIEIPAHLDWSEQNRIGKKRTSGMRIFKNFFSGLMASFIFRPYIFYLSFGFILFLVALYIITWIFINTFQVIPTLNLNPEFFDDRFSEAIRVVFQRRPHAFFVGGITLILSIQILSLGFLSLQNKRYFEETFHLGSNLLKQVMMGKSMDQL